LAQTSEGENKPKVKQVQRTKTKLVAQSGENNVLHIESNTKFFDSSTPHEDLEGEKQLNACIPRHLHPIMKVDLQALLLRPYLLETVTWTSANTIRTLISTKSFPRDLLDVVNISDKLAYIQYIAPDIEMEVQINGTKFHYGRVIFPVVNIKDGLDGAYTQPEGSSTWPQWYQISANSQQSVKVRMPWKNFVERMPMIYTKEPFYDMYNVRMFVAVPLSLVTTDTPPSLTISIYARFIDTRAEGYQPNFVAQSGEELLSLLNINSSVDVTKRSDLVSKPVSSALTSIAKVANDFSNVASAAGFSNPINPASTNSMQIRQVLFGKADDMPNSVNLGPSQSAVLNKSDGQLANGTTDEMSIVKIVTLPSLVQTGKILAINSANTTLWTQHLTPRTCKYSDYSYAPSTGFQPLPPFYIGRLFKLWRGSFKIHISFIASSFHSCRVRFIWAANVQTTGLPEPMTNEEIANSFNVVMDINKQTEYSLYVPFYPQTEWLQFDDDTDKSLCCNGQFKLVLQTPLTSMAATVEPIYYQIFVSMCEDAQFAAPTLTGGVTYGNPYYQQFSLLSNEEIDEDNLIAQASETLMCELPSSSSACLRNTEYINVAGDKPFYNRVYGYSTSYEYSSVKQLSNMLSPIAHKTASALDNFTGYKILPFGLVNDLYSNESWSNYYAQIRAIYRYGRGSFRFSSITTLPTQQACAYMEPVAYSPNTSWYGGSNGVFPGFSAGHQVYMTGGYQYFSDTTSMPVDITIPYYSVTPCKLFNSKSANGYLPYISQTVISWSTQTSTPTITILGATADDFEFGGLLGMPYLRA